MSFVLPSGSFKPRRRKRKPKGSLASQALALARKNRRKIRNIAENTNQDVESGALTLNATAVVTYISPLAVPNEREFTLVRLEFNAFVKQNLTSAILDDYRIDIILDRNPEGANPTALEFYLDATPDINVHLDYDERSRFKLLRSARGILSSSEGSASSKIINWRIPINMKALNENAGTVAIATQSKTAIFLVHWTTATANQPAFQFTSRMISHA